MQNVTVNGVRLAVEIRGTGTPLLLAHGFPLSHAMWLGQLEGLSDRFQVIAPDLRGFGASDVTPGTVTMEQFADDLAGLLDALDIREPVVFCGLSMGGYIAWQFVQRHSQRLRGLIVCDTRALADSPEAAVGRFKTAADVLAHGSDQLAETMTGKLFSAKTQAERPQVMFDVRRMMFGAPSEGVAAALRGMAQRPDVTAMLPTIAVPTLVLCGAEDRISPPDEMRQIADAIPGAQYVEIAGAGHMAPTEEPAAVNAAIVEFVAL